MTDTTTFGRRVRQARRELSAREGRDISQKVVGRALGVTYVTVSRWENDLKEPGLETIRRLAEVLECSPCYLAFGRSDGDGHGEGDGERLTRPPDIPAPAATPQSVPAVAKEAGTKRRPRRG